MSSNKVIIIGSEADVSRMRERLPEEVAREAYNNSEEGKLLTRYRFDPWKTETSARQVAHRASKEIRDLRRMILKAIVRNKDSKLNAEYQRYLKSI